MPTEIYEVVAQGARYWFLFLMALIVWRSYRWYRRDRRQRKKRLRLLPDAGYVGELVVVAGGGALKIGSALPVPREGTLGFLRSNDVCVPVDGVAGKHLWFCFDDNEGLMVEPYGRKPVAVDGEPFVSRRNPLYMSHGSRLTVGAAELRLRLFAGFETAAGNRSLARGFGDEPSGAAMPQMPPEQYAAYQQWMRQQMAGQAAQPGAYAQPNIMTREQYEAYRQQWLAQAAASYPPWPQGVQPYDDGADEYTENGAYDEAADAPTPPDEYSDTSEEIAEDVYDAYSTQPDAGFYPPATHGEAAPDAAWPYMPNPYEEARPSDDTDEADELTDLYDDLPLEDDDLTDAVQPPKSAYVGHDDAELAKKKVWDRYLGGGRKR